mmetsp:Transcript_104688/g.305633  ORF Transcript_104688/g.305633 Transcript_104688/m.305633 type:complete len:117 (+) Transcript_104688:579-929(+)
MAASESKDELRPLASLTCRDADDPSGKDFVEEPATSNGAFHAAAETVDICAADAEWKGTGEDTFVALPTPSQLPATLTFGETGRPMFAGVCAIPLAMGQGESGRPACESEARLAVL